MEKKVKPSQRKVVKKKSPTTASTIKKLVNRIKKSPEFIPSFRSEIPLGMTDDMLALTRFGLQALPALKEMLSDETMQAEVRKAAVVMLSYIDSSQAEKLIRTALNDPVTRPVALVCLGNFFMRPPDSPFASEHSFLRQPDLTLLEVLDHIEDETEVILNSGFEVYCGPVADLAIGASIRILGLEMFADLLDMEDYFFVGLIPHVFHPIMAKDLKERLKEQRERLRNLMRGRTGHGTITASEIVTPVTRRFKLSFDPDNNTCTCSKIGWIQIVKVVLPNGSFGYPAGIRPRDTDNDGWFLDQFAGYPNPVYFTNAAGTAAVPYHGKYGKCNGAETNAELKDKPSGPVGTKFEFESCVFCLEGTDAGKCYGCYKWTVEIQAGGAPKYTKQGASTKPSAQFEKSAREWNALSGKTDTPNPSSW